MDNTNDPTKPADTGTAPMATPTDTSTVAPADSTSGTATPPAGGEPAAAGAEPEEGEEHHEETSGMPGAVAPGATGGMPGITPMGGIPTTGLPGKDPVDDTSGNTGGGTPA